MLGSFIQLPVPDVAKQPYDKLINELHDENYRINMVSEGFVGNAIAGEAILCVDNRTFNDLPSKLSDCHGYEFQDDSQSVFLDVASTLIAAFLKSFSSQLDLELNISQPAFLGMSETINNVFKEDVKDKQVLIITIDYEILTTILIAISLLFLPKLQLPHLKKEPGTLSMSKDELDISNLHWVLQILQNIEVGLIVFDRDYEVKVWNGFMENHSGISSVAAKDKNLFKLLPTLPESWFEYKVESVLKLGIQAHCNWQQEPHILNFENTRPFTAKSDLMFQNVTLFPLFSTDKKINHICALVYDVSDEANNLLKLKTISQTDALTHLFNRGHWQNMFEQEFLRCQRYDDTASVVMMDIDHFKAVNDTYGHQLGDKAIQLIAKIILDSQRETDICGRYGGEGVCHTFAAHFSK